MWSTFSFKQVHPGHYLFPVIWPSILIVGSTHTLSCLFVFSSCKSTSFEPCQVLPSQYYQTFRHSNCTSTYYMPLLAMCILSRTDYRLQTSLLSHIDSRIAIFSIDLAHVYGGSKTGGILGIKPSLTIFVMVKANSSVSAFIQDSCLLSGFLDMSSLPRRPLLKPHYHQSHSRMSLRILVWRGYLSQDVCPRYQVWGLVCTISIHFWSSSDLN